jgi:uncharacterized protein
MPSLKRIRSGKEIQICIYIFEIQLVMERYYEWDTAKASSNLRKHGIAFEEAAAVFDDPFAMSELDRIEAGQERWQTLGISHGIVLLLVAHTVLLDDMTETIRIISARRADRKERKRYEQSTNQTL